MGVEGGGGDISIGLQIPPTHKHVMMYDILKVSHIWYVMFKQLSLSEILLYVYMWFCNLQDCQLSCPQHRRLLLSCN